MRALKHTVTGTIHSVVTSQSSRRTSVLPSPPKNRNNQHALANQPTRCPERCQPLPPPCFPAWRPTWPDPDVGHQTGPRPGLDGCRRPGPAAPPCLDQSGAAEIRRSPASGRPDALPNFAGEIISLGAAPRLRGSYRVVCVTPVLQCDCIVLGGHADQRKGGRQWQV